MHSKPKSIGSLCLVLSIIFTKPHASLSQTTCPIELQSFTNSDCTTSTSTGNSNQRDKVLISIDDNCQFILDGLYRASCENNLNTLLLEPCFLSSFIKPRSYELNLCFASNNHGSSPYSSFIGSCDDVTSCLDTESPTASSAPTSAPTQEYTVAATVELPSPPLPPNAFADEPLDIDLAHEIVYLTGRLIYQMDTDNAASLLPEGYTFHMFTDTGSTEVMVISTEHEEDNNKEGKIMVLFRGTDDTPDGDWLTNINLPKVPYGPENAVLEGSFVAENCWGFNETYEVRLSEPV